MVITHITDMDLEEIIKSGGGVAKLARDLRLHHTTVMGWKAVPPHHAREVARLTGKTLHDIRPDLWEETDSAPSLAPPEPQKAVA